VAKQPGSSIQSVERAIAVLKSFDHGKPEWGVNELARRLSLDKSSASRLLATLEAGGLLARDPDTRRYRLGVELIGMADHVISYLDVRQVARPILRQLAEECRETVNLSILDAGEVVNVERFISPERRVSNIGWVGRRTAAHCTAAGKVFLAYMGPDEREATLRTPLRAFTARTITGLDPLRVELGRVHAQGYGTAQEELEEGLNAVAAPVFDHTGRVQATISVSGPAYRVTPELFCQLAARLVGAATRISAQLGYAAVVPLE
jgi:IclR family acetate operon transcriptional repressor